MKPDIVEKIVEHIKSIKFDFVDSIVDADNKYFFFKRLLFNNSIEKTHVIDFPFSDHCFVLVWCKFYSLEAEVKQVYKRNLKPDIVEKIVEHIKSIKFDFLDSIVDADNKYFFFKRLLFNSINLYAPLKRLKFFNRKSIKYQLNTFL